MATLCSQRPGTYHLDPSTGLCCDLPRQICPGRSRNGNPLSVRGGIFSQQTVSVQPAHNTPFNVTSYRRTRRPPPPLELGFCAFTVRKCTKFGLLTLRIITKIVAIICQILRLKCTKFDFGWSSQTLLREFTALPRHPKSKVGCFS